MLIFYWHRLLSCQSYKKQKISKPFQKPFKCPFFSDQDSDLAYFLEDLCHIEKLSEIKIPPFLLCQSLDRVNRTYIQLPIYNNQFSSDIYINFIYMYVVHFAQKVDFGSQKVPFTCFSTRHGRLYRWTENSFPFFLYLKPVEISKKCFSII